MFDQHPKQTGALQVTDLHERAAIAEVGDEILNDDEQRARIWPVVAEQYPKSASDQKRNDREIPLVLLKPT